MGENVSEWIFEYVSETEVSEDEDTTDDDSSDESTKDWRILKEESQDKY